MKNFIIFLCKFCEILPIFSHSRSLKGGVRAEPLYEVNFLFFIFYEAFAAQIKNSLNSLNSSLFLLEREREKERERERERERDETHIGYAEYV